MPKVLESIDRERIADLLRLLPFFPCIEVSVAWQ